MNKELILKYKTEFDHWLNDKEVLACPIKNKLNGYAVDWQPIDKNALWDNENIAYIINDEYVEFRKALSEGKTVQYNFGNYGLNKKDFPNTWKDIDLSIGILSDRAHPNNYRIKPEEPKFKVSDWIRQGNFTIKVHRVESDYYYDKYSNSISVEKAIKWQPKPGEWCWFMQKDRIPVLSQLQEFSDGKYFATYPNGSKALGAYYKYCEPFFGELPSHLKD